MRTQTTSDEPLSMPATLDPNGIFAIIRAEVAKTIAALGQPMDGGER